MVSNSENLPPPSPTFSHHSQRSAATSARSIGVISKKSSFSLRSAGSASNSSPSTHSARSKNNGSYRGSSSPKGSPRTPTKRSPSSGSSRSIFASLMNLVSRAPGASQSTPSTPRSDSSYKTAPTSPYESPVIPPVDVPVDDADPPSSVLVLPALEDSETSVDDADLIVPDASVNPADDPRRLRRDVGSPVPRGQQVRDVLCQQHPELLQANPDLFAPSQPAPTEEPASDEGDPSLALDVPPNVLLVYASPAANPRLLSSPVDDLMNQVEMRESLDESASGSASALINDVLVIGDGSGTQSNAIVNAAMGRLVHFPALRRLIFRNITITGTMIAALALHQATWSSFIWDCIDLNNCTTSFAHNAPRAPIRTRRLSFGHTWDAADDPSPWLTCVDWGTVQIFEVESQHVMDMLILDLIFTKNLSGVSALALVPPTKIIPVWMTLMSRLDSVSMLQIISVGDDEDQSAEVFLPPIQQSELPLLEAFEGPISCAAGYCYRKDLLKISLYGRSFDRACLLADVSEFLGPVLLGLGLRELTLRVHSRDVAVFFEIKDLIPGLRSLRITLTDDPKPGLDMVTSGVFSSVVISPWLRELYIDLRLWWRPEADCFFADGEWGIRDLLDRSRNVPLSKVVFSCVSLFTIRNVCHPRVSNLEGLRLTYTHPDNYLVRFVGPNSVPTVKHLYGPPSLPTSS